MKIISYNVNGIRAAMKKGFIDWLVYEQPDVICVQEIKALQEQIDIEALEKIGYKYNYWYSAHKKGYSGVGIISKQEPNNVSYGTGISEMDFEGRNIRVDFDKFSVMSLYLPSGTNLDRLEFKLSYMDKFYVTYADDDHVDKHDDNTDNDHDNSNDIYGHIPHKEPLLRAAHT